MQKLTQVSGEAMEIVLRVFPNEYLRVLTFLVIWTVLLQLYSNKLNDKIHFHTTFVTSVQNRLKMKLDIMAELV